MEDEHCVNYIHCTSSANALRADLGDGRFWPVAVPPQPPSAAEIEVTSLVQSAIDTGVLHHDAVKEIVFDLVGDATREPCMYLLETDAGAISQTHYKHVAEEFAKRPEYTVTPIYPRRRKVVG